MRHCMWGHGVSWGARTDGSFGVEGMHALGLIRDPDVGGGQGPVALDAESDAGAGAGVMAQADPAPSRTRVPSRGLTRSIRSGGHGRAAERNECMCPHHGRPDTETLPEAAGGHRAPPRSTTRETVSGLQRRYSAPYLMILIGDTVENAHQRALVRRGRRSEPRSGARGQQTPSMEQETCTLGAKLIRGMGGFFKTWVRCTIG